MRYCHFGVSPVNYSDSDSDDLWVTLTYFTARSYLVIYAFLWEKVKTVDFSETIAACDLKVGRCRQLIEIMKLCEYWRSRSFLYHIFSRFCMFCALQTSRYQVSVYRTNGPLVFRMSQHSFWTVFYNCFQGQVGLYLSLIMRKPAFCICENKDTDQLRGYRSWSAPLFSLHS